MLRPAIPEKHGRRSTDPAGAWITKAASPSHHHIFAPNDCKSSVELPPCRPMCLEAGSDVRAAGTGLQYRADCFAAFENSCVGADSVSRVTRPLV